MRDWVILYLRYYVNANIFPTTCLQCAMFPLQFAGISLEQMGLVKSTIYDMWKFAGTVFEVFCDKEEPLKGYRLRVRMDFGGKMKLAKGSVGGACCGWVAMIPKELLCGAHIFQRSTVQGGTCYLGGPISYMNYCPTLDQKLTVMVRGTLCTMECRQDNLLCAGLELMWNYGENQKPTFKPWFYTEASWALPIYYFLMQSLFLLVQSLSITTLPFQCCRQSSANPVDLKRHEQYALRRSLWFMEACVLCGHQYSISNKDNRAQRKPHFVGLHADYFGSDWDGCTPYNEQPVSCDMVLRMADRLNQFIATLKRMNYNVLPACKVFSEE